MIYPELKIALDIGDPKTVLSSQTNLYVFDDDKKSYGYYFVVCDDGDMHCFDKDGKEREIDYIPHNCFKYDNSIVKINIEGIESIGDGAFYGCRSLIDVTISDRATSIGWFAFTSCTKLTNVTIGSGVTYIGLEAFSSCGSLKSIVFKGKTIDQVKAMDYYPWGINTTLINVN